jgi:hypothetical protein
MDGAVFSKLAAIRDDHESLPPPEQKGRHVGMARSS